MSRIAIVALPRVDDKVYKISSEKVPHLTLAFLGEQNDADALAEVVTYVQHAASQLSPFGMSVERRGELGADQADVLFFKKDRWNFERIADFRHHLLLSDTVKKMYDSQEQFDEWNPHLTLGYPDAPAKEDDSDDSRVYYVEFDRVAVWIGDYDGPEFLLKYEELASDSVVAWSDMTTTERGAVAANEMFHYGKKGMRWGVRKAEKASARAEKAQARADKSAGNLNAARAKRGKEAIEVSTKFGKGDVLGRGFKSQQAVNTARAAERANKVADKKWAKVDKKWEKSIYSTSGAIKVHNNVADQMNSKLLHELNSNPKWKDADLTKPENSALHDEYMTAYLKTQSEAYARAVNEVHGRSPSGKKQATYVEYETPYGFEAKIEVKDADIKHAEGDDEDDLIIFAKLSKTGHITSVNEAKEQEKGDELTHYGVKGMRWGVTTKDRAAQRTPTDVTVTQKKPGTFAKTEGGENHPIHEDAAKALAVRQKAKSSTTDAVSNADLRAAVERMQLEQRYSQLEFSSDRRSRGARFLSGFFGKKKPTKYRDIHEGHGEQTADAVKKAMAARAAIKAAKVAATAAAVA